VDQRQEVVGEGGRGVEGSHKRRDMVFVFKRSRLLCENEIQKWKQKTKVYML